MGGVFDFDAEPATVCPTCKRCLVRAAQHRCDEDRNRGPVEGRD